MRPTYAEIDLGAIRHNVAALAAVIAPSEVCAVVKADAYGHGDAPVAEAAVEAGATRLAVALVEEGVRLREAGIEAPILVLSEPDTSSLPEIATWSLTPTVYSNSCIEALGSSAPGSEVHIKIDTGMHRVGASPRLLRDLVTSARGAGLEVAGIWTHFPVADEDPVFTRHQIEVFDEASSEYDAPLIHLANTAGAVLFPESRRSLARIGLGIYGLHPCAATRELVQLQPAMRIVTHVSHVQRLEKGARPSYGRIRPLAEDSTVVTAPIGYADGFSRRLSEAGVALIGGNRYPLAGTVTMDQIVIEVGESEVHPGDEVVVLGEQGGAVFDADEWARILDTISYEVVCGIGPRVPRRYLG
ncbi:MAG TPA: alanine racemase [Acidimicrobiia bacterium]|nr:alanine racemase [Acidimicrobiia bacterium]